jgi:hypothetical protein
MQRAGPLLAALAVSAPIGVAVAGTQWLAPQPFAQGTAFVAVVLGLPWIVPALVVVSVLSAPAFIVLHAIGQPQELMPWLSGVILVSAVAATHVNAALLWQLLSRARIRTRDTGLADFLVKTPARTA